MTNVDLKSTQKQNKKQANIQKTLGKSSSLIITDIFYETGSPEIIRFVVATFLSNLDTKDLKVLELSWQFLELNSRL